MNKRPLCSSLALIAALCGCEPRVEAAGNFELIPGVYNARTQVIHDTCDSMAVRDNELWLADLAVTPDKLSFFIPRPTSPGISGARRQTEFSRNGSDIEQASFELMIPCGMHTHESDVFVTEDGFDTETRFAWTRTPNCELEPPGFNHPGTCELEFNVRYELLEPCLNPCTVVSPKFASLECQCPQ